jgi:hypothetical protein
VPLYDERFKGYGMNKIAHLYQVALEPGMRFWVWRGGFLVSRDHDNSPSWEQTYGKTKVSLAYGKSRRYYPRPSVDYPKPHCFVSVLLPPDYCRVYAGAHPQVLLGGLVLPLQGGGPPRD